MDKKTYIIKYSSIQCTIDLVYMHDEPIQFKFKIKQLIIIFNKPQLVIIKNNNLSFSMLLLKTNKIK
jgi:hypothetical protein